MNFEFRQRKIKPSIIALSICTGLVLGTIFVLMGGYNVATVYSYLIKGSLGSVSALTSTIRWSTIFLLCGVASVRWLSASSSSDEACPCVPHVCGFPLIPPE